MKHNVILEGWGCRLRPETKQDNRFVVDLWNQPYVQGNLTMSPLTYEGHMSYYDKYETETGTYFWIVENSLGTPLGTLGIDSTVGDTCVTGRLAMYPTTDFIVIAPIFLMYQFIFEQLCLKKICFTVLVGNKRVQKLHNLIGARYTGQIITKTASTGEEIELMQYELSLELWANAKNKMRSML
jgi:hypothetical protein